jgi:cyclohexyl-isocyanide hydratase
MALAIGFLLYPNLTQLDLTGPYEVLSRLPGAELHLVWKDLAPVRADSGLALLPTTTVADCPALDVLVVPGGAGQQPLMDDDAVLSFLRAQGEQARYVTAVCTGSLLLGAAGLLRGYHATCHWQFHGLLAACGAIPTDARVVVDRNRITGGGVTAGIDFALRLVAELADVTLAQTLELLLEYAPEPPFGTGRPELADPALVAQLRSQAASALSSRALAVTRALARTR